MTDVPPYPASVPSTPDDVHELCMEHLTRVGVQDGKVLLGRVSGSYGHGVWTPDSDLDTYIVYAAPTEDILLAPLEGTVSVVDSLTTSLDDGAVDVAVYEIKKWLELVAGGSPLALEAVAAAAAAAAAASAAGSASGAEASVDGTVHGLVYTDPCLAPLLEASSSLMTRQVFRSVLGHTLSELKQIDVADARGAGWAKLLYHAQRLMFEVEELYAGRPLKVVFTGEQRALLSGIRDGSVPGSRQQALRESIGERRRFLADNDPFPDHLPEPIRLATPLFVHSLESIRASGWTTPPSTASPAAASPTAASPTAASPTAASP